MDRRRAVRNAASSSAVQMPWTDISGIRVVRRGSVGQNQVHVDVEIEEYDLTGCMDTRTCLCLSEPIRYLMVQLVFSFSLYVLALLIDRPDLLYRASWIYELTTH